MTQTRRMSLLESVTNVVVGYMLAIITQIVVFPLFGIVTDLSEHLAIGLAFVVVSLARGFVLRRIFEHFSRR
jgi:uncharacterized membrane protein